MDVWDKEDGPMNGLTLDDLHGERWAMLDEQTREDLRRQARETERRLVKVFDPLTGQSSLISEDVA